MDAIFSYGWLAKNFVDVKCGRHGLMIEGLVNLGPAKVPVLLGNVGPAEVPVVLTGPVWVSGVVYQPSSTLKHSQNGVRTYGRRPYFKSGRISDPEVDYTVRWPFSTKL